jgi:hypothetical protein
MYEHDEAMQNAKMREKEFHETRNLRGDMAGCATDRPMRDTLLGRMHRQRQQAQSAAAVAEQLQEFVSLLESEPKLARILDLYEQCR